MDILSMVTVDVRVTTLKRLNESVRTFVGNAVDMTAHRSPRRTIDRSTASARA